MAKLQAGRGEGVRVGRWGGVGYLLSVAWVTLVGGCAQPTMDLRPAGMRMGAAGSVGSVGATGATGQVETFIVSRSPCYLTEVDGTDVSPSWGMGLMDRRVIVAPGIHTVRLEYDDGRKYSLYGAEISFVAEAGHTYAGSKWPPVIVDVGTGKQAKQQLKGAVR